MPKVTERLISVDTNSSRLTGPWATVWFQRYFEGEEKPHVKYYMTKSVAQMERARRVFNAIMDRAVEEKKAR